VWACTSIRVVLEDEIVSDVLERFEKSDRSPKVYTLSIADGEAPLDVHFSRVKDFLRENMADLRQVAEVGEINVYTTWTPNDPQDGLQLDEELIALLASVGGYFLLDTLSDG